MEKNFLSKKPNTQGDFIPLVISSDAAQSFTNNSSPKNAETSLSMFSKQAKKANERISCTNHGSENESGSDNPNTGNKSLTMFKPFVYEFYVDLYKDKQGSKGFHKCPSFDHDALANLSDMYLVASDLVGTDMSWP
ncbi:hypothetical protein FNV43_RR07252 [Rhamnella rubrinervis]|uniref:Uncharacterized protein n=1 Tax=Rhamnella rubrinervis TaxID=2594499 RepID=A0A8K0MMS7_9ROSA|nr:hypothetical protein FNV43_RR07252 [Rhamnella rubrinervis]